MAHDYKCLECGAFLDPGEKCTCREEKTIRDKMISESLKQDEVGQFFISETSKIHQKKSVDFFKKY